MVSRTGLIGASLPRVVLRSYVGGMRIYHRTCGFLAGAALVAAVACGDATTKPHPQSPLVGTWELTTHFDTFTFETGSPSPPDCTSTSPYCTHKRTTVDGAYLGGTLQVQDSLGMHGVVATSVQANGVLMQSDCDSIDYRGLTGCTHVRPRAAVSYVGDITGTPDSTTTGSLDVVIHILPDQYGDIWTAMRARSATYAGDSIYGRVVWGDYGRSPPTYYGSFVMRRVK